MDLNDGATKSNEIYDINIKQNHRRGERITCIVKFKKAVNAFNY